MKLIQNHPRLNHSATKRERKRKRRAKHMQPAPKTFLLPILRSPTTSSLAVVGLTWWEIMTLLLPKQVRMFVEGSEAIGTSTSKPR